MLSRLVVTQPASVAIAAARSGPGFCAVNAALLSAL
jgi:hypothetical protein